MNTKCIYDDAAENSIMQTITIAVSAILIASGLVTAPGLINNARDNNARTDLANVAYAEEMLMGTSGQYHASLTQAQADASGFWLGKQENIKYTLSGKVSSHKALVCNDPNWHYLAKATSSSGKTFFRASGSAVTSTDITKLNVPSCITNLPAYSEFISGSVEAPNPITPVNPDPPVVVEAPLAFTTAATQSRLINRSMAMDLGTNSAKSTTYSVVDGELPTGTALKDSTITGDVTKSGTYNFTIEAKTPTQTAEQDFTVKVVLTEAPGWSAESPLNEQAHDWKYVRMSPSKQYQLANDGSSTFRSADYGSSWTKVAAFTGDYVLSVSNDGTKMWAASRANGDIQRSLDGGLTWMKLKAMGTKVTFMEMSESGNGVVVAYEKSAAYHYTNLAGPTTTPTQLSVYTATHYSMVGSPIDGGFVIANSYKPDIIRVFTSPSTNTYKTVTGSGFGLGFWMGKYGTADSNITGINTKGEVWKSTDNGNNWTKGVTTPMLNITELEVTSAGYIVVINDGKLFLSKDAGATWTDISPNPDDTYVSVETTANNGITLVSSQVGGKGGYVYNFTGTL
jgi:photosystem II stability/assembly factor-like uncharacterized protein